MEEKTPLSYDEHEELILQVSNANGDIGSINEILQRLRDNYRIAHEVYRVHVEEISDLKDRFQRLERQNLDLFLKVGAEKIKDDENEDVEKDDEVEDYSFDDLFDEKEGS